MARKKDKTPGELIAKSIIETYDPKTTEDIQDALKSIFGPIFESMLDGEMEHHLGFSSNSLINTSAFFFATMSYPFSISLFKNLSPYFA